MEEESVDMLPNLWTFTGSMSILSIVWFLVFRWGRQLVAIARAALAARPPQSDADFLAGCQLEPGTRRAEVAIALRHAMAELGGVPTTAICGADRLDHELDCLDFRDSYDFSDLIKPVKSRCGLELDYRLGEQLYDLEVCPRGFTAADFVRHTLDVLARNGKS